VVEKQRAYLAAIAEQLDHPLCLMTGQNPASVEPVADVLTGLSAAWFPPPGNV
jgi:hypothetical protein